MIETGKFNEMVNKESLKYPRIDWVLVRFTSSSSYTRNYL